MDRVTKSTLEIALVENQLNLNNARRAHAQARRDYNAAVEQLINCLQNERWQCQDCDYKGEPKNVGEHNQQCAACGSRNVRLNQPALANQ